MVVALRTMDGKVRVYETARGEGGGENGPSKYITKCGMEWETSPEPYESCDHIDCAIDIQRRRADGGSKFFLFSLVASIILFFIIKDGWDWVIAGVLILVGILSFFNSFGAEDKSKELTEYNHQRTINGIRAYPADVLTGLMTEKDCMSYGLVLCGKGRYEDAIEAFDKAIKLNPSSAVAWNNKGNALKLQNKHDEAIMAFDKSVELNPKYTDAWNNKGMALYDQHKYDKSILAYDTALEIKPKLAKAWYNKGLALCNQGKYQEAIWAYDKAIKNDSKNIDALYNKSITHRSLGQIKEADETLDLAKRELNCKGAELSNSEKHFEAIQAFDKAIGIDPKFLCAWVNKGITLSKMGRFGEAIEAINHAIEINPESPRAWKYKGIILKRAGSKVDSKHALARARELGYKG